MGGYTKKDLALLKLIQNYQVGGCEGTGITKQSKESVRYGVAYKTDLSIIIDHKISIKPLPPLGGGEGALLTVIKNKLIFCYSKIIELIKRTSYRSKVYKIIAIKYSLNKGLSLALHLK